MFEEGAASYRVRPNEISLLNFITYVIAFVRKQPRERIALRTPVSAQASAIGADWPRRTGCPAAQRPTAASASSRFKTPYGLGSGLFTRSQLHLVFTALENQFFEFPIKFVDLEWLPQNWEIQIGILTIACDQQYREAWSNFSNLLCQL